MTTQKLTCKVAKRSLLPQEYDFTVRVANTSARCLSRHPLPSAFGAPLLDWAKGEVMAHTTFLAMIVGMATPRKTVEEERDI